MGVGLAVGVGLGLTLGDGEAATIAAKTRAWNIAGSVSQASGRAQPPNGWSVRMKDHGRELPKPKSGIAWRSTTIPGSRARPARKAAAIAAERSHFLRFRDPRVVQLADSTLHVGDVSGRERSHDVCKQHLMVRCERLQDRSPFRRANLLHVRALLRGSLSKQWERCESHRQRKSEK